MLNWKTPPKKYEDLIQVTDNYVVHARGWTVDDDIWLDEYNLHGEHKRWWDSKLRGIYDRSWDDEGVLYWSITGSGTFIVQHPREGKIEGQDIKRLQQTLNEIGFPRDEYITWKVDDDTVKQKEVREIMGGWKNDA